MEISSLESVFKIINGIIHVPISVETVIVIGVITGVVARVIAIIGINDTRVPAPKSSVVGHINVITAEIAGKERVRVPRRDYDVDVPER